MAKKWIFFIISVAAIAAFLGCHAGGSAPFVNTASESDIISFEREVGDNGRFADIVFPSGAVIKCTQDGTLKKGTKVTATEQKTSKDTPAYIYNITAKLYTDDALNTAVSVNTLEKPISVSLPNNSTTGTCYIGTRANQNDPWRYSLASDGITSNARFIRLSANPPKTCSFNLYRLAIEFALFVLNNQSKEEALVDSVEITPEKEVETKDGKYTGALTVKMNVEGENLNNIDPANLVAKIIYRSENKDGANINFATNKTDSEDKAVSGIYEHTFEITKIDKTSIGNTAELTFELNLDGVSLADFPSNFIVELYSKSDDKNTLPFTYTQEFGFETKENQDNPDNPDPDPQPGPQPTGSYSIKYELNGGKLAEGVTNPSSYNEDSDTIKLNNPTKDGYTFIGWSGTDLTGDTNKEVKIAKGSTGDREYKANWQQNAPDEYTLTLLAGTGIASVDDEKAYKKDTSITLNCTVIDGYQFDKWSDSEGNAVTSPFTMPANAVALTANAKVITYNITYQNTDGATFATANPTNYTVETADFTLTNPTKDDYIFLGWTYEGQTTPQLKVTITKGSTGAKTYTANWGKAVASLKSAATDFAVDGQIQIEFDKDITWQDSYKSNIAVTPTSTTTPVTINTYSYSNKVLTLTPASNLKYNTGYTIAIAGMEKVSDKNLTFTTIDLSVTPVIISASTNTVAELEGKTILQPTFTIDFGKAVVNQTSATSSVKLNANALPDSATFAFDTDGKIATLTFSSNLDVATAYQLSITGFTDDDNSTINAVSAVSFTTISIPEEIVGAGTQESPYLIFTEAHLNKLRESSPVNYISGNYYYKQMNDITLTSANWTPIGKENSINFYGKYDGNSHKITGLKIDNNGDSFAGLFWRIVGNDSNKAEIRNLTLENVNLSNGSSVGALAGYIQYADITNVKITGNINIDCGENIGGLAGTIYDSSISDVHISGNINVKGSSAVGGLAGQCNNVKFSRCSVDSPDGLISAGTGSDVGGLAGGFNNQTTENSSISESYASIKVQGNNCVGGLVGALGYCTIENSYSDCEITVTGNSPRAIGGLVGGVNADNARFTNCYSKGTIKIESTTAGQVGGLCGGIQRSNQNYQNSTNSFTFVTINVSDSYTGGSGSVYNPADGVPLYYSLPAGYTYVYSPDDSNHNYLSNGYPATGLTWSSDVWSGLSTGSYPTLINNPPPAQP